MKALYKIEILNWEKWNPKSKPSMEKVFISKRFFDDHAIQTLPAGGKLLYLGLLLRRGDVSSTSFIASHDDLVRFAGGSGQVVERLMALLEQNQLLTYEKIPPNRIELKRIKDKVIEKKGRKNQKSQPSLPGMAPEVQNLVPVYCDAWKARYGTNPLIGRKDAGQLKNLVKDHGFEKSTQIVEAYLKMPDSWFMTKRHDIATMVTNLNSISHFIQSGRLVTKREIQNAEASISTHNLIRDIQENGI